MHPLIKDKLMRLRQWRPAEMEELKPLVDARVALLDEAKQVVTKDRGTSYGLPEDNFRDIAALWTTFKGYTFTSMDVAVFMMLVKVSRLKKNPSHHDSLVDIAGYAACAKAIQDFEQRTAPPPSR